MVVRAPSNFLARPGLNPVAPPGADAAATRPLAPSLGQRPLSEESSSANISRTFLRQFALPQVLRAQPAGEGRRCATSPWSGGAGVPNVATGASARVGALTPDESPSGRAMQRWHPSTLGGVQEAVWSHRHADRRRRTVVGGRCVCLRRRSWRSQTTYHTRPCARRRKTN
jgi:hypothetical protein